MENSHGNIRNKKTAGGFLDVETEEERSSRIERLLASQVSTAPQTASTSAGHGLKQENQLVTTLLSSDSLNFDLSGRGAINQNGSGDTPRRLDGPSQLLARLEAFLPELRRANETLDASQASIEDSYQEGSSSEEEEEEDDDDDDDDDSAKEHNDPPPPGGDQRLIELTLGLGVFELKGQPKRGDAAESPESEAEDSDTESTSSASSSSIGSSDGELPRGSVTEVPRAGMKRKRIAAVQGGEGGGATGAVSAAQGVSTTRSMSDPPSMKRRTVRSPTSTEPSPPVTMMAGTPLIREVDASDKDGHRA